MPAQEGKEWKPVFEKKWRTWKKPSVLIFQWRSRCFVASERVREKILAKTASDYAACVASLKRKTMEKNLHELLGARYGYACVGVGGKNLQ